jgi:HSP20 family protein
VFGLRREIDRLFEDTFGRGEGGNAWTPAVDVRETDKEVRIDVELPGVSPDEVEITAENGVLTIRGEKQMERKEDDKDGRFHVIERAYGTFVRSFQLPQGLDESKIEAEYDNGMLAIHLPKAALPQPRRIQIGNRGSDTQRPKVQQSQSNQQGKSGQTAQRSSSGESQPAARAASSPQAGGSEGNR